MLQIWAQKGKKTEGMILDCRKGNGEGKETWRWREVQGKGSWAASSRTFNQHKNSKAALAAPSASRFLLQLLPAPGA